MRFRVTIALVLMTACSETGGAVGVTDNDIGEAAAAEDEAAPIVIEQCDAEDYRALIGTPVAGAALDEAPMLRVYGENDIITQEYLPRRTNIVYDSRRVIQNVYCG